MTQFTISESSARWTFLFYIFETPYLNTLGMLSIPLFINFLQKVDFIACEPSLILRLAELLACPFPVYLRLLFLILFNAIADGLNVTFFLPDIFLSRFVSRTESIPRFLFLSPTVPTFFSLMLEGDCCLLILSYLARESCTV